MLKWSFLMVLVMQLVGCQTPAEPTPPAETPAVKELSDNELDCPSLKYQLGQKCCAGQDAPCLACQDKAQKYLKLYREKCPEAAAEETLPPVDPFADLDQADCAQLQVAAGKMCCMAMIDACQRCSDKVKRAQILLAQKCAKKR
jgi:hypothetical protein